MALKITDKKFPVVLQKFVYQILKLGKINTRNKEIRRDYLIKKFNSEK